MGTEDCPQRIPPRPRSLVLRGGRIRHPRSEAREYPVGALDERPCGDGDEDGKPTGVLRRDYRQFRPLLRPVRSAICCVEVRRRIAGVSGLAMAVPREGPLLGYLGAPA